MQKIELVAKNYSLSTLGLKYLLEENGKKQMLTLNTNDLIEKTKKFSPDSLIIISEKFDLSYVINTIQILKNSISLKGLIILCNTLNNIAYSELKKSGVNGFISLKSEPSEIIRLIEVASDGHYVYTSDFDFEICDPKSIRLINDVEMEILKLIAREWTNKEIALKLNYSISSVEYYVSNIFSKLSVKTRVGAVREGKILNII